MTTTVQNLDLPHFDRDSPDVFFNLLDAMMRNLSITDEKLILYYLSRGIPQDIFELTLTDQYNALSDKDKIIELKRLTIEECEKSKEEPYIRAHKLKKREDQTEPEFLRKLMTITRACQNEPELTKRCYLNNLTGMKYVMAKKELKEGSNIVDVARNLEDYFPKKPDEVNAVSQGNAEIEALKNQINRLTVTINAMQEDKERALNETQRNTHNRVHFKEETSRDSRPTTPPAMRNRDYDFENSQYRMGRSPNRSQPMSNQYYGGQNRSNDYPRPRSREYGYPSLDYRQDREPRRNYSSYNNQQNRSERPHYQQNPRFGGQAPNWNQNNSRQTNSDRRNPTRSNYNSQSSDICFYHQKFGRDARRCDPPCKMQNCRPKNESAQPTQGLRY